MDATNATYPSDPRLEQARDTIAKQLGILPSEVSVKIGRDKKPDRFGEVIYSSDEGVRSSAGDSTEELVVTIHKPGLDLERPRITEEIRAALAQLAPLAEMVQMVPQEQIATQLRDSLKAATEGTNFNQDLLDKWPGFDPKQLSGGRAVPDYALQSVDINSYGVTATLGIPEEKGVDHTASLEQFSETTKGRIEQIKEIQLERVLKYTKANLTERGLNAQEAEAAEASAKTGGTDVEAAKAQALADKIQAAETKVRADFEKLQISVNVNKNGQRNELVIIMRSPEQQAAYDTAPAETRDSTWNTPPTNADELSGTNPLTSPLIGLTATAIAATDTAPETQPQLQKVIARSIFFDKEKNITPGALPFLGRNDMKAAIIKEIKNKVLAEHPDKTEALQTVLDSDLFKNHNAWHSKPGTPGSAKPEPIFTKPDGINDTLEMSITLRQDKDPEKNELLKLVNGLASNEAPAAAPVEALTETAAAAPTPDAVTATAPDAGAAAPAADAPDTKGLAPGIASILAKGAKNPADQSATSLMEQGTREPAAAGLGAQ